MFTGGTLLILTHGQMMVLRNDSRAVLRLYPDCGWRHQLVDAGERDKGLGGLEDKDMWLWVNRYKMGTLVNGNTS